MCRLPDGKSHSSVQVHRGGLYVSILTSFEDIHRLVTLLLKIGRLQRIPREILTMVAEEAEIAGWHQAWEKVGGVVALPGK